MALASSIALYACADGALGDGAARRLPSAQDGHAMVRLPAASTAASGEPTAAEHRSPPRRPKPR
ncbi:hypothetical protein RZS08_60180, partial [Arthrospira platensis SPKY1]|nr:hypothetical protein [Arthrospira platensis SPKY1]